VIGDEDEDEGENKGEVEDKMKYALKNNKQD
jgi:hypothetical protein